ncbi:hypothetical protein [Acaryochloris marina]|nr:hypothetical protein [Acaryochloris marina]
MDRELLFDCSRNLKNPEQWRATLATLRQELSEFLECPLVTTSSFIENQHLDCASYEVSLDVIAQVNNSTNLQYGGVICLLINYDEAVYIDAFFLPFVHQRRIFSYENKLDVLSVNYAIDDGWNNPRWDIDAYGEWESYLNMDRWL